jgi:tRNA pseudouridine55 synthase
MHEPLTGVIAIDKPPGVSSRRVVDAVAAALGSKAVGHAGTLDPLAQGVVVVCVGRATRLVDFVHELPKRYHGTFLLGRASPSDDLETPVEEEAAPVRPTAAAIAAALPAFRGPILQRPCDYSAVHVAGKRAYRLARQGRDFELAAKPVRIDRLEVTAYDWPRLGLDIACSSGTFVRAIGRDLAVAVGTRAVMETLVRSAVGPFEREAAVPLAAVTAETVRGRLLPAAAAVAHLPQVTVDAATIGLATRGGLVDLGPTAADCVAACDEAGDLVGILRRHDSGRHRLRPNFRGAG